MKLYSITTFFLYLLLSAPMLQGQPQATLTGTVTSLDGSSLPRAHVMLKPYSDNLFYHTQTVAVDKNDRFQVSVPKSGVYRLTITGAMHKDVHMPVWIREPDTLHIDARLDPKNLDDGEYFNSNEYISWIRVTGNFNGYNYDRGVRFERVAPKTLRATITTSLDTLHYQIVGLTSGTTVLPGAADYRLRDSQNYEAVVPVTNDRVIVTYKADSTYFDNRNPYKGYRTTWDLNQSKIQFGDEREDHIQKNLNKVNLFDRLFNYAMFDSDTLTQDVFEYTMQQHYKERWKLNLTEIDSLENRIKNLPMDTNEYLRQSMHYKYLLLSENIVETDDSGLLEEIETEPGRHIDTGLLHATMDVIPPESPLWSLNRELILVLPAVLGYADRVTGYLEEMVMKHQDNDITGRVLFKLFTHSFDSSGRSEKTKKYYRLILDAFGDNYYARKAREYVQADN